MGSRVRRPAKVRRMGSAAVKVTANPGREFYNPADVIAPDRPATAPAVATLPVACMCGRVVVNVPQSDVRRGSFDPPTCPRCPT